MPYYYCCCCRNIFIVVYILFYPKTLFLCVVLSFHLFLCRYLCIWIWNSVIIIIMKNFINLNKIYVFFILLISKNTRFLNNFLRYLSLKFTFSTLYIFISIILCTRCKLTTPYVCFPLFSVIKPLLLIFLLLTCSLRHVKKTFIQKCGCLWMYKKRCWTALEYFAFTTPSLLSVFSL